MHPCFLFGGAEAYPQNIGRCFFDDRLNFVFFVGRQGSKGRAISASDLNAVSLLLNLGQPIGHSGSAAVKEVAVFVAGLPAKSLHKFRSVDTAIQSSESSQAAEPDQGHTIRNDEIRGAERTLENRVSLGFRHSMHPGYCDIAGASGFFNTIFP